jgi:cystathionine beta-lyase
MQWRKESKPHGKQMGATMRVGSTSDFNCIIDRRGTASEKWDRYSGQDIIPLWVADMDFRSPPAVIEALQERVSHGVFGYTHPPAELAPAVLGRLEQAYGLLAEEEWLVWIPGLVCGLSIACRAVGDVGDEVVAFTPVYPPFMSAPLLSRRTLIKVPLRLHNGRWEMDPEELERTITARTRLLMLCNPHNPVGRAWSAAELTAIAEAAERHDLVLCSDEIHSGLVLEEGRRHISIASLSPSICRRTITLQAPSKTFNIPGLACSFAVIADPELRSAFRNTKAGIVPSVNTLGYTAALAAYRYGEPWRRELIEYLRGNRDLVRAAVGRMEGLTMTSVEATYLAWIDTRESRIADPARFFEDAGVGLSDGADFGAPGFVRLNFGCPRPLLATALERMAAALASR